MGAEIGNKPKLEVIKRFIEQKEQKALEKCIERLLKKSERIGFGDNADVLGINDKHFGDVCMKKMYKNPRVRCNEADAEFEYQQDTEKLGVRVPKLLAYLKNPTTNEKFILMERIVGPTLGDVLDFKEPIPNNYNHDLFWVQLNNYLNKMHAGGIHHRDLHKRNIMIDADGGPVIIDFGTAGRSFGSEDNPYKETVPIRNPNTGRYDVTKGYFQDDKKKVEWTKNEMTKTLPNLKTSV